MTYMCHYHYCDMYVWYNTPYCDAITMWLYMWSNASVAIIRINHNCGIVSRVITGVITNCNVNRGGGGVSFWDPTPPPHYYAPSDGPGEGSRISIAPRLEHCTWIYDKSVCLYLYIKDLSPEARLLEQTWLKLQAAGCFRGQATLFNMRTILVARWII